MRRVSSLRIHGRRRHFAALLALALAVSPLGGSAETPLQREDRIKAALIFKLIKFVEWPAASLSGRDPLQICALGASGVGEALASVDGKPARDRLAQFRVVEGVAPADTRGCHVLFIPASARDGLVNTASAWRGRAVLTVSDAPGFARRGGMVGLTRGENKVSFEINLRNARDAGLEPGAPLLELATIVE